ncbi:hypothetical protein Mettu_1071 [Methylobacter tundripaludum SV96]|uniref:Uncharacterized protein n=1 Tax=Methylobacter tundripaludum (strain ATCC BAA-1195 / DSM 17260 / SV96) TaxID=697282 RepID=G3IS96_METTV|nr:hypothetical protein Mettu_1071 [Methylobacter tundripaludum SV96]
MTRRDFGKPAFSLRKKRFVKTHALSLLGTTRLLSRSEGVLSPREVIFIALKQEKKLELWARDSGEFRFIRDYYI